MGPLRRRFSCLFVVSSILGSLSIAPARAQAPVDSSETPRYLLPPIVVTAERAPVPLDRVPAEVTVQV